MFGLLSRKNNKRQIKDFYTEIGNRWNEELDQVGVQYIPINTIVGSVSRTRDLDHQFRSRQRGWTERHEFILNMMRQGKPMPPIQVFRLNREQCPEYYIVDGHHRVAAALQIGFDSIQANIIDITLAV